MGHKVNPKIFRTPYINQWQSKWITRKSKFRKFLKEDSKVRDFLEKSLKDCGISQIDINRESHQMIVTIKTAKPGLIIGKGGLDIEKLRKKMQKEFLDENTGLKINVVEEPAPLLSSRVILEKVISNLEKRMPYRYVLKGAIKQVRNGPAKGVKVQVKGRLGGVEIAREEKLSWGKLPLQTLRADIDYSQGFARTLYGSIGVKVWIYRGEKF